MHRPTGATIGMIVMTVTGTGIPAMTESGIATATMIARHGAVNIAITSARNGAASVATTSAVGGSAIAAMTIAAIPAGAKG
jgi:hypothetical protein